MHESPQEHLATLLTARRQGQKRFQQRIIVGSLVAAVGLVTFLVMNSGSPQLPDRYTEAVFKVQGLH